MTLVYGIDFGTSQSALMISTGGTPVVVRDPIAPGESSVPTSVCLDATGRVLVGAAAERARLLRPDLYTSGFKRDFGGPTPTYLGDTPLWSHELAAAVLGFLRDLARSTAPGEPDGVVLTVPAAWEVDEQRLVVKAAELAGFDLDRLWLVPEPVAAATDFLDTERLPLTALVYDLGGGTFDCALARTDGNGSFSTAGIPGYLPKLGGRDFDREILERIRAEFPEQSKPLYTATANDDITLLGRRLSLREQAEKLKIRLSRVKSRTETLTPLGPNVQFTLTRAELAGMLKPLLEDTFTTCTATLERAELTWNQIDRVVAVGGSSRLPFVGELLGQYTGLPVVRGDSPELAVVRGATLLAQRKTAAREKPWTANTIRAPRMRRMSRAPLGTPGAFAVALNRNGTRLAVGGRGFVRMYACDPWQFLWERTPSRWSPYITNLAFSTDGTRLVASGYDWTVRVYRVVDGLHMRQLRYDDWVFNATLGDTGMAMATVTADGVARVYDGTTERLSVQLTGPAPVSLAGDLLAVGGPDAAQVWRVSTGTKIAELSHGSPVVAVALNATFLATGSTDGTAAVWNVHTGQRQQTLRHDGPVRAVTLTYGAAFLGTASDDFTARAWRVTDGTELTRTTHGTWSRAVAFTGPDHLISACHDGTVRTAPISATVSGIRTQWTETGSHLATPRDPATRDH
ncbi:Hsp70 family protein [Actinokineospora inagensis]|uniref:Hsp70 family protein n=1 Tax=Actinokineospora inagensis TaxID=103730 RepID=UPI00040A82FB|nr:Hsp70 family protein [Actinokineospora inagensis]